MSAPSTTSAGHSTRRSTHASSEALEQATLDRLQAVHDTLTRAVADLADGEAWRRMLRTAARFHHYSPHNVLLITAQCPDAQAVAGYQTWKQLDRQVRKGESGIAILAPVVRRSAAAPDGNDSRMRPDRRDTALASVDTQGAVAAASGMTEPDGDGVTKARRLAGFRVVHVFDISQTDGPPLPSQPLPELLDGQAPPGLRDALAAHVTREGYRLTFAPLSLPHPGLAGANGVTDYLARTVTVRPDLSDAQTVKTLAHELGHVLLHAPEHRPATLSREQAEVEAESVAYVIGAAHGLDTSSYTIPYVTGWAGGDLDLVRAAAERVLGTARRVLDAAAPSPAFEVHDDRADGRTLEQVRERSVTSPLPAPLRTVPTEPPVDRAEPDRTRGLAPAAEIPAEARGTSAPAVQPGREVIDLSYADQAPPLDEPSAGLPSAASQDEPRRDQQLLFRRGPDPAHDVDHNLTDHLSDQRGDRGICQPAEFGGLQR